MKNFIGTGGETPEELLDLLSANADECEEMNYTRRLSADEMLDIKESHSVTSVKLKALSAQKKDAMSAFKVQMKPLEEIQEELITKLTNKAEYIKMGTVYKFIDKAEGRVGYYNPQGELVTERPMNADERQLNIMGNIREIKSSNGKD